jgi:RNA ligase (TIGR02306 family)
MERKLATIERISEIHPIPDADAIERAVIRGWNIVVKKGDHKVDDLVVYCEIDSIMPERPEFEFLRPRGFRIKTIKLRGQVSQGIAFPLSILPMNVSIISTPDGPAIELDPENNPGSVDLTPGIDVTEVLGITKYEPQIPACLSGIAKGNFPSHSIKTDEERIQNLKDYFEEYKQHVWVATEKLDGTSTTYSIHMNDNEFEVSSRNLNLKEDSKNSFWAVARALNIEYKMRIFMAAHNMPSLTLQGELIGEGIQDNKYKIKGQTIRFFRAFDPIKYEFLSYDEFMFMLDEMGLTSVPIIDDDFTLPEKFEDLILYADGKSALADTAREGVVFVAKDKMEKFQNRLSFKVISNKFILKHDA